MCWADACRSGVAFKKAQEIKQRGEIMKKIIAIILAVSAMCSFVGCKGKDPLKGVVLPEFSKAETGLRFTAYSGPPSENWSGTSGNPECITDEHYKELHDAGFNKVLALREGLSQANTAGMDIYEAIAKRSEASEEDAVKALELSEKYGIKYSVRDWAFYGLVRNYLEQGIDTKEEYERIISKMFDESNPYIHMPAYGGNFGHDEPSVEEMEKIVWQTELYYEYMEKAGVQDAEMYINLLPCYASTDSLSTTDSSITYEEYVDYYIEHLAPLVGYICYDYYPFRWNSFDGSQLRQTYLYNLELMAQKCKEYKAKTGKELELRTFLQCISDFTGIRDLIGIGDLRFQIYTEMAFGSKEFIYYCYATESMGKGQGLLDYMTGKTTWLYESAKTANNEVLAMQDAYLAFDWDAVMYHNADIMLDNQSFANLRHAIDSHDRIQKIDSTQDTLVGVFKGKQDESMDAFMIVNYTDPYFNLDNEVTVTFKDAKALLMYRLGQKVVVPLNEDGSYTFKLYPGEGRFVIPLK